jgi:phage terminase small subunit
VRRSAPGVEIKRLTPKQQRFVREYLIDLNATQAAIRAGYSEKTAYSIGNENLRKPEIAAAIQAAQAARSRRTEIDADQVLLGLAQLANSDIGDILDFSADLPRLRPASAIPAAARRAIASVKVKRHGEKTGDDAQVVEVQEFKLWDKLAALRELALHLGLRSPHFNFNIDWDRLTEEECDRIIAGEDPREVIASRGARA